MLVGCIRVRMRAGNGLENNAQGLGIQPHYQVYFSIVLAAISYHGQDVFVDRLCDLPGERAYGVDIDLESRWAMGGADAGERNLLWDGHGGCMREEMGRTGAGYIYLTLCMRAPLSSSLLSPSPSPSPSSPSPAPCDALHHHHAAGQSPNTDIASSVFNSLSSFHAIRIHNARTDTPGNHLSHRVPSLPLPPCAHNIHAPHRPSSNMQGNLPSYRPGAQYAPLCQNI